MCPGRIDHDVFALLRVEKAARGIDRDPLRLLILQGIQQERVFERLLRSSRRLLSPARAFLPAESPYRPITFRSRCFYRGPHADDHNVHPVHITCTLRGEASQARRCLPCPAPGRNAPRYSRISRS